MNKVKDVIGEGMKTNSSRLLKFTFFLDDYEVNLEDVVTVQLNWERDFCVEGKMVLKDTFDFSNQDKFKGTTIVTIYGRDVHEEIFLRRFRVTFVRKEKYNEHSDVFELGLMDIYSYEFKNTYLSKGFYDTPANIIEAYLEELQLNPLLKAERIQKDFETSDKVKLVVPQDRCFYDFIKVELDKLGLVLWQERKKLVLRKKETILPPLLPLFNKPFKNNSDVQMYGWLIDDMKIEFNNIVKLNEKMPNVDVNCYDFNTKLENEILMPLSVVYWDNKLSVNESLQTQQTRGVKLTTQERLTDYKIRYDVADTYNMNNSIELTLPGNFKFSQILQRVDLQLKGNINNVESRLKGDKFFSGQYYITSVKDRFIGERLVQRYKINRVDFNEPIIVD